MATLEERVARLEGVIEQIHERLNTLQWTVGLSMAWTTMLIGCRGRAAEIPLRR